MSPFAGEGGMDEGKYEEHVRGKTLTHEPKDKHGLRARSPFWVFVQREKWQRESEHE